MLRLGCFRELDCALRSGVSGENSVDFRKLRKGVTILERRDESGPGSRNRPGVGGKLFFFSCMDLGRIADLSDKGEEDGTEDRKWIPPR